MSKWNAETIQAVALTYSSKNAFYKGAGGAYQAAKRLGIFEQVTAHMPDDLNKSWSTGSGMKELRKLARRYKTREGFKADNPAAYNAAYRLGVLDDICKHMPKKRKAWTLEEAMVEAKKYTHRGDFHRDSHGCWAACKRHGWLEQVCHHMPAHKVQWDHLSVLQIAKLCFNQNELRRRYPGAYTAAKRNNWVLTFSES